MKNKKLRVAVLFGGMSPEHEVSVITGLQAIENIDKENFDVIPVYIAKDGKWYSGPALSDIEVFRDLQDIPDKAPQVTVSFDNNERGLRQIGKRSLFSKSSDVQPLDVIFPAFHGGLGENGGLAGVFEAMNLPYVGPGITGGALGMDKIVMKQLFAESGLPITKWMWFYRRAWQVDQKSVIADIEKQLAYPLFVKPATGGSSIGTTKAHNKKELENAIEVAVLFDRKIIVEESFENAREINISVLGNAGQDIEVSVCEEVFSSGEILSYEDKYIGNGKTGSKGMAQTKRQIPAKLSKDIEKKIQETAKKVFEVLDGSGVCRIDFLYNEKTGKIAVIESNTIPGSLSFYLWEATGMTFSEVITKLIELAIARYDDIKDNTVTFSSNILENFKSGGVKGTKS